MGDWFSYKLKWSLTKNTTLIYQGVIIIDTQIKKILYFLSQRVSEKDREFIIYASVRGEI